MTTAVWNVDIRLEDCPTSQLSRRRSDAHCRGKLNSKLRSPLQLNRFFTPLRMPRDPCFFSLLPNYFLSTSTTLKRLPTLLFTLKTFHTNLIKTVVAVTVFVMPGGALSHLWPSSRYNSCWEMRYEGHDFKNECALF